MIQKRNENESEAILKQGDSENAFSVFSMLFQNFQKRKGIYVMQFRIV